MLFTRCIDMCYIPGCLQVDVPETYDWRPSYFDTYPVRIIIRIICVMVPSSADRLRR